MVEDQLVRHILLDMQREEVELQMYNMCMESQTLRDGVKVVLKSCTPFEK